MGCFACTSQTCATSRVMNSRHTAVLALLGWYLTLPPHGEDFAHENSSAPMSMWSHLRSYDTCA